MVTYGWEQHALAQTPIRRLSHRFIGTYDLGARVRYRAVSRAFARIAPPHSILDAGSGRGQLCFAMHRRWPNATIAGVDCDFDLVEHSRALIARIAPNAPIRFERRTLPGELDEQYDLITSVDVLEHVENDRGFLSSLCAATKPAGALILHTPATPQRRYLAEFEEQHDHVREGYRAEELASLLTQAGYSNVAVHHTFGPLEAIAWEGFALARRGDLWAKLLLPAWYVMADAGALHAHAHGNGLLALAFKP